MSAVTAAAAAVVAFAMLIAVSVLCFYKRKKERRALYRLAESSRELTARDRGSSKEGVRLEEGTSCHLSGSPSRSQLRRESEQAEMQGESWLWQADDIITSWAASELLGNGSPAGSLLPWATSAREPSVLA